MSAERETVTVADLEWLRERLAAFVERAPHMPEDARLAEAWVVIGLALSVVANYLTEPEA